MRGETKIMDNEISTKAFDERGETILLKGDFHNKVFILGIVLAITSIIMSSSFLTTGEQTVTLPGIDYMIIIVSAIFLFVCIKELLLNRKRMMCLTGDRVFGNTGLNSFDLLYTDIVDIEEKTKKSFINGNMRYLYIKTNSNTELKIEQLKNIEKVVEVIKAKRG